MPWSTPLRPLRACLAGLAVLGCAAASAAGPVLTMKTVAVCDDVNEWPPFTYLAPNPPGATPTRPEVLGFSVEVLRRVLAPAGVTVRIDLLPWVRCLREVASGTAYQMALNASANPERQQRFWMSDAYHATTPGYFYSRRRYPQGVPVQRPEDLTRFRVCGVHGYNYSAYGLRDDQVDRGALNFSRVIAKLLADRCELGVGELEVVKASLYNGRALAANPEIGYARIPGMAKVEFHMLVSRQHPQGEALVQRINAGLKELRERGQLQAIHKRYTD